MYILLLIIIIITLLLLNMDVLIQLSSDGVFSWFARRR